MLMGNSANYKGQSSMDVGVFFCPYVPGQDPHESMKFYHEHRMREISKFGWCLKLYYEHNKKEIEG